MSHEASSSNVSKSRAKPSSGLDQPSMMSSWAVENLEKETSEGFSFAKAPGTKPTSSGPAPARPPAPKSSSSLPFPFQSSQNRQSVPFGTSSAPNQHQQDQRQRARGPTSSSQATTGGVADDPTRPARSTQSSSQLPSSTQPSTQSSSKVWTPRPSQLFHNGPVGNPGGSADAEAMPHAPAPRSRNAPSSSLAASYEPDSASRPQEDDMTRPARQREDRQPRDQRRSTDRDGRARPAAATTTTGEAPTSSAPRRVSPTDATLGGDDEDPRPSLASSSKGKGPVKGSSSQRPFGFGADAAVPTSLDSGGVARTTTDANQETTAVPDEPGSEPANDIFGGPDSDDTAPAPEPEPVGQQPTQTSTVDAPPSQSSTTATGSRHAPQKSSSKPPPAPKEPTRKTVPLPPISKSHAATAPPQDGDKSRFFADSPQDTSMDLDPTDPSAAAPTVEPSERPSHAEPSTSHAAHRDDTAAEDSRRRDRDAEPSTTTQPAKDTPESTTTRDGDRASASKSVEPTTRGTNGGARRGPSESGSGRGGSSQSRRKRPRPESEAEDESAKKVKFEHYVGELHMDKARMDEENKQLKQQIVKLEQSQKETEGRLAKQKEAAARFVAMHAEAGKTLDDMRIAMRELQTHKQSIQSDLAKYHSLLRTEGKARKTAVEAMTASISQQREKQDEAKDLLDSLQNDARMRADGAEQSLEILKKDLTNKVGELAEKSSRVAILEEKCDKKEDDLRAMSVKVDATAEHHRAEVDRLHAMLATAQSSALANDAKMTAIETALAASRHEYDEMRSKIGIVDETEMAAVRLELQTCQRTLAEKDGLLATLQRDMDAQIKTLETASKRTEDLQQELANARARVVEVEHELSLAQQAVKQEVSLRNDARTALQTSVEANVQTRERLAETRTKLDERDAQLKVATEQINNLQQEKTRSEKKEADQLRLVRERMSSSDHPDASEEIAGMNREMMRLQGENHELSSKAVRLEREVNNLELVATEKATLEAKLAEAEAEKDALKAAHEATRKELAEVATQCSKEKENAATFQVKLTEAQKNVVELQKKKATLVERYNNKGGKKKDGLDRDEIKLVEELHKVFQGLNHSERAERENLAKKQQAQIKALSDDKKTLEAKLSKTVQGKSRSLITDTFANSSPVSSENGDASSNGLEHSSSPGSPAIVTDPRTPANVGNKAGAMPPPALPSRGKNRPVNPDEEDDAEVDQLAGSQYESGPPPKSSSSMSSTQEGETQIVAVSQARKDANGAVIQRGQADAAAAAAAVTAAAAIPAPPGTPTTRKRRAAATVTADDQQQAGGQSDGGDATGPLAPKKKRGGGSEANATTKQGPTTRGARPK